ncbi:MAG: zinc ribbon domain-containing protein [Methanomicrobia archaeon]|nr:zinc ribbon domain-containing protein [Methanomicrobia archaeon]
MFCKNCGAELEEGDRFCSKCGTSVSGHLKPQTDGKRISNSSGHLCAFCDEVIPANDFVIDEMAKWRYFHSKCYKKLKRQRKAAEEVCAICGEKIEKKIGADVVTCLLPEDPRYDELVTKLVHLKCKNGN